MRSYSQNIQITPVPAWVSKIQTDYSKTSFDKKASDGYIDLEYQHQVSLADQSVFIKDAKKLLSQAGVQNASEISVSFDPSYEKVSFHSINIIRNGKQITKLTQAGFRIISPERELNEFIYNGTKEALFILEDVRPGDIIEYSYSIKGFNPIYKNKYSSTLITAFAYPFYRIYYRIVVPEGRKINIKYHNTTLQPKVDVVNKNTEYIWDLHDVQGLKIQQDLPSWYDPYPDIQLTEYNSWKEVNDWALTLFPENPVLSAPLTEKIKQINISHKNDADKLQAVLRFVQDEIRYMGIEMGESSHKPAHPSKVFAQRFGDCKEKAYLACSMLRAMNIEAQPVLVDTESKGTLKNKLPSNGIFNHVVFRVKLDNDYYWYDATRSFQRGNVKNLYFPDFQTGLVVSANTNALTQIPFRDNSSVVVNNEFKVTALYGKGSLIITSKYSGRNADNIRDHYYNTNPDEIKTDYKEFYERYYNDIEIDSLDYSDNENTGVFTTIEYYTLPQFWTTTSDKLTTFTFSPFSINSTFEKIKEKKRNMPIGLDFPLKYKEQVIIELPEEWAISHKQKTEENKCFRYSYELNSVNNMVYLKAEYENLKDHVTVEESEFFFKKMEQSNEFANFEISFNEDGMPVANQNSKDSANLIGICLLVGVVIGLVWWNNRKK